MSCEIRDQPAEPIVSTPFWIVLGLVWLDLSMTFMGIYRGVGEEANPFYAVFTTRGLTAMIVGAVIYITILLIWWDVTPNWITSITAGFLTTVHIWGVMSWLRNWVTILDPLFSLFWLIIGPALLGSVVTFWTYVDVDSCRERIEWITD